MNGVKATADGDFILAETIADVEDTAQFRVALNEHAIVAVTDARGRMTAVNDKFCAISKYSRAELLGKDHRLLNSGYHPKEFFREMWATIGSGQTWHGEIKNRAKDGSTYWVETTIVPFMGPSGRPVRYIAMRTPITAQKEMEERFRQVVENIQEVFWVADIKERQVLYISPGYDRIWGQKSAKLYADPWAWTEAIHPEDRSRVRHAAASQQGAGKYDQTFRLLQPNGSLKWIRARSFPVREGLGEVVKVVGIAEDLTEEHNLEAQFLHAQRLEAVGTLAGGVAHDLNNILAPILMAAGLLKDHTITSQDAHILGMIETSARRGAEIVRQLLSFSRSEEGQRGLLQPRHLLKEMLNLMQETFPRNIAVGGGVPTNLPLVEADATQLHQVIMNLCVNARDAMPAGGKLCLDAFEEVLPSGSQILGADGAPGHYVALKISDTGEGISPDVFLRIFEPFFTTKAPGKGTGLGLSTVAAIVKRHGGFIKVESEPGKGSAFTVFLPVAASGETPAEADTGIPARKGNGELILVVDDEQSIRDVTREVLERNNYRVITAANGAEAITLFIPQQDGIRLAVVDMMMPVMAGDDLIRSLQILNPKLKLIVLTGMEQEEDQGDRLILGTDDLLMKPCMPKRLLEAVARKLAED